MLGPKSVRLDILDEQRRLCSKATGFFLKEQDGLFFYTTWHVVTGIDFLDPKVLSPPSRRTIVANMLAVEVRQPGVTAIGGNRSVEMPLYNSDGVPLWLQEPNEREHSDLNALGIHVPKFIDVVRVPVDLDPLTLDVVAFGNEDILPHILWDAGRDVVIMGYPYGYSTMDKESPEPVFLKRSVASNRTKNSGMTLLDGGGAPGMSGSPVIVNYRDRWWLFGMYTGIIFPDYAPDGHDSRNDRAAALGLMVSIDLARAFMRVPGRHG